jgi:hypothetical protein
MQKSKRVRPIIFVCSCVHNNELITKMIVASSVEAAADHFLKEYGIQPKDILVHFIRLKHRL